MSKAERKERLMPNGVPRWIRCYDNGGETADRYTVIFTEKRGGYGVGMSADPFGPLGFGQHFDFPERTPYDCMFPRPDGSTRYGMPPVIGRKHPSLGRRIAFSSLPTDCKRLVIGDYKEAWGIE